MTTRSEFADLIERTMANPSASGALDDGRTAFWNDVEGVIVIHHPASGDRGTAFKPTKGKAYFDGLIKDSNVCK